jgi:hypothetical protein
MADGIEDCLPNYAFVKCRYRPNDEALLIRNGVVPLVNEIPKLVLKCQKSLPEFDPLLGG